MNHSFSPSGPGSKFHWVVFGVEMEPRSDITLWLGHTSSELLGMVRTLVIRHLEVPISDRQTDTICIVSSMQICAIV